jgi:hypothetical protein
MWWMPPDWIWDLKWVDWWTAVQGVALVCAAIIAWYQIGALRRDQRGWETLKACEKYDTDPVLGSVPN